MVKDKGFYSLYPTPLDLLAPIDCSEYPYDFDVFSNFHYTRLGMSVCVRHVSRGRPFRVSCRGFVPVDRPDLRLRCDSGWSDVCKVNTFLEARRGFDQLVRYLLSMTDDERLKFQSYSVVKFNGV